MEMLSIWDLEYALAVMALHIKHVQPLSPEVLDKFDEYIMQANEAVRLGKIEKELVEHLAEAMRAVGH